MTIVLALLLLTLASPVEPSREDWEWLGAARIKAFDALFPVQDELGPIALVSYRFHRSLYHEVHEQYLSIHEENDEFVAVTVAPAGRSVQEQLLDLHMHDKSASFEEVLRRVQVVRRRTTSSTCKGLVEQLHELRRLRFSIPAMDLDLKADYIVLHPPVHRLTVSLQGGSFDATISDATHPLVQWAKDTTRVLATCPAAQ